MHAWKHRALSLTWTALRWFELISGGFQLSIKLNREKAFLLLSTWAASLEHFGSTLEHFAFLIEQKQWVAFAKAAKSGNATLPHFGACSHPFSCFSWFLLHLIWCSTPSDVLLFRPWTQENHQIIAAAYTFLNFNICFLFLHRFLLTFFGADFLMQFLNYIRLQNGIMSVLVLTKSA